MPVVRLGSAARGRIQEQESKVAGRTTEPIVAYRAVRHHRWLLRAPPLSLSFVSLFLSVDTNRNNIGRKVT